MKSLVDMLPEYYQGSHLVSEIQKAAQYGAELAEKYITEKQKELSITTCSEKYLVRYEKIYGIKIQQGDSVDFRRENVLAKMRSTGALTVEKLKEILSSYGCGDCNIVEDFQNYKVTIEFLTLLGEPPDFEEVVKYLRQLLPAHLTIEYKLLFNTWNDTSDNTYSEFSDVTWNELAVMEGVK